MTTKSSLDPSRIITIIIPGEEVSTITCIPVCILDQAMDGRRGSRGGVQNSTGGRSRKEGSWKWKSQGGRIWEELIRNKSNIS